MRHSYTGRIAAGLTLTYRVDAGAVARLLPDGLEPATRGAYGFVTLAACRVEGLRPCGVPAFSGLDAALVCCAAHAQAATAGALVERGLVPLRTDASPALVDALRDRAVGDGWMASDVAVADEPGGWRVAVRGTRHAAGDLSLRVGRTRPALPRGSAYATSADAHTALGGVPTLFAMRGDAVTTAQVLAPIGSGWGDVPVSVEPGPQPPALAALGLRDAALELALALTPTDAAWSPGPTLRLMRGGPLQHCGMPERRAGEALATPPTHAPSATPRSGRPSPAR